MWDLLLVLGCTGAAFIGNSIFWWQWLNGSSPIWPWSSCAPYRIHWEHEKNCTTSEGIEFLSLLSIFKLGTSWYQWTAFDNGTIIFVHEVLNFYLNVAVSWGFSTYWYFYMPFVNNFTTTSCFLCRVCQKRRASFSLVALHWMRRCFIIQQGDVVSLGCFIWISVTCSMQLTCILILLIQQYCS